MIIMDLDRGDDVRWQELIDAAVAPPERLRSVGLESIAKTSGAKDSMSLRKAFTKRIADAVSADSPDRFVATVTKSKHKGKDPPSTICATAAARPPSRRIRGLALPYPCDLIGPNSVPQSGRLISWSPTHFPGWPRWTPIRGNFRKGASRWQMGKG